MTLIAHQRNSAELLALPDCDPSRIHFVPDTRFHRIVWHVFRRFPERIRALIGGGLMNIVNERYQAGCIRKLVAEGKVDVIHQPIPVSPLMPSNLHRFGVPLVVGPMNGGMDFPQGYEDYEAALTSRLVWLGRRGALLLNRLQPGKHHAALLLVANDRTRQALPDPAHPRVRQISENGVDLTLWDAADGSRHLSPLGQLNLVYIGRFIALKAIDVTLRAVALARESGADVSLDLIGDGECRAELTALAGRLGIADHVTFHGFQTQPRCAEILARADALVLNSLRECGGAVVLEAMAMGLPVVASAWGGPLDYLDDRCGILVDPRPRADFPQRLSEAFVTLANDPELRRRLGQEGQEIARRDFDWDKKVDQMIDIYREAAAQA